MVALLEDGSIDKPQSSDSEDDIVIGKKRVCKKFIDTDSDEEHVAPLRSSEQGITIVQHSDSDDAAANPVTKKKRRVLVRSESEPDDDVDNVSIPQPAECVPKKADQFCEESNCDGTSIPKKTNLTWYKDSTLYDAEDSDDEIPEVAHNNVSNNEVNMWESESPPMAHKSKQKPKSSATKTKKSAKTDKDEVQKIYSESQRMLRETKLSLPYHKPRQRTIAEFLQRRRSLPPMPKSLKVSKEQMKEICKQLEEREKEAREFFKSESEDSDTDKTPEEAVGDSCVNQESSNVQSTGTDKILEDTNEGTVNTKDKTEGTIIDSGKCEMHNEVAVMAVEATVNENQNENSSGNYNVSIIGNVCEDGIITESTDIQGNDKCHTDNVQALHNVALKLFGSNVGNSAINPGETLVSDTRIRTFLNEDTADTTAGMPNNSLFKPSMSECSQVALDCAYDETSPDSFKFKEPVKPLVAETTTNSELDSQSLVLHMSEEFDKDESLAPVASLKESEQGPCSEEPRASENVGVGSKTGENDNHYTEKICNMANTASQNVNSNEETTESDLVSRKNNYVRESEEQNLPVVIDSDVLGLSENDNIIEKVNDKSEEKNSRSKKQGNNPEAKVELDLSEFVFAAVSDDGGALCDSGQRNRSLQTNHELDITFEDCKNLSSMGNASVFRPRLIGDSTDIIDLEEVSKPAGIRKLIERFMKHSSCKKKPLKKKQVVELGVVSAEKGPDGVESVKKDVLSVTLGENEDVSQSPELTRPGAKFRKLKEELLLQIARQREEEWNKKEQEDLAENISADNKSNCSPSEDEVEEITESESEDDEDDEEEEEELDSLKFCEKKKPKSAFVDDEAEVSDEGNAADVSSDEEDEGDVDSSKSDDETEEEIQEKDAADITMQDNPESVSGVSGSSQPRTKFSRLKTLDMFDSNGESSDGGIDDTCPIPAYQPGGGMKCGGVAPLSEEKASQHHFLSPIFSLPIRSNRPSSVKSLGTPNSRQTVSSAENTPHTCGVGRGSSRLHLTQKKLFAELEPAGTQDNVDELLGLCSGKFGDEMDNLVNPLTRTSQADQDSELLGLCSGKFESQVVQLASLEDDKWRDTTESSQVLGDSQDLRLTLSDDILSPVKSDARLQQEITPKRTLDLASSDEEGSVLKEITRKRKLKKHSQKKLNFSDDENEPEVTQPYSDYKSLLSDSEDDGVGSVHSDIVAYDSEENEVVVPSDKGKVRSIKEFFENEAELSESEWGSADEDEQGLDNMDSEDGDEEQLDSKKVKEQLDRIHMRRMMDDDNREVRLLQELLFEDGELHSEGGGRQRKFRWKNVDNLDENYQQPNASDEDVYDVDDEDEEQWRRMRHQREKFLLEQQAKGVTGVDDTVPDDDSQLMKLGKAALKKIRSSSSQELEKEKRQDLKSSKSESLVSPDPKRQFQLLVKRGSFLARGETALARLAQLTKGAVDQNINGPKNSRKFVFATISPVKEANDKKEAAQVKMQKRKSVEVTPPVLKKLRLSEEVAKGRCLLDLLVP